ncbi:MULTISPECIES: metal-dependent transcriptional regulator [Metallosphaera]|uniref:Iron dependent repressor n=3 Tax=Metallosphaera TaxID=41980 RepID=A4YIF3_METS5|nr:MULTISPECIES: metal-dependent transcriptional regulator [Metallosphaera]ABP96205.1 iron dependent repressor [Metallosphaera sedula DSM 5348]AIM28188.1 iron dependent repressor [Metallosphaera sedula]AKV75003.1 DtxR family iron (metal) dependent repressor [Metallosphaera sedula]AKV77241.1 DtxR family iron (metal) dependent repressor [Metallosphaera sedula]AKV79491.1 DtxR family iron (metal) dependent repressor [Metallosphaera sedula]
MDISEREIVYLSAIREMNDKGQPGKLSIIAKQIEVSPASAFEELKHLEKKGLISKENNNIYITEEGRRSLTKALRAHRVIESLLVRVGIDPETACSYSKQFELKVPDEIIEKLYEYLGKPNKCPHGNGIP